MYSNEWSQSSYKDYSDQEARCALLSVTARLYIYLNRLQMTTSAAAGLMTELCENILLSWAGLFKLVKISPTTITVNED